MEIPRHYLRLKERIRDKRDLPPTHYLWLEGEFSRKRNLPPAVLETGGGVLEANGSPPHSLRFERGGGRLESKGTSCPICLSLEGAF